MAGTGLAAPFGGDSLAGLLAGLLAGTGDIGGDFRCSGFGIVAGFSALDKPTMCFGLSGLSLRAIVCLVTPFDSCLTTLVSGAGAPLVRSPGMPAGLLNPLTFGTRPAGRLGVVVMSPLSRLIGITVLLLLLTMVAGAELRAGLVAAMGVVVVAGVVVGMVAGVELL